MNNHKEISDEEILSNAQALEEALDAHYREGRARAHQLNEAFEQHWPHYCRTCSGWGAHTWRETHGQPYGAEVLSDPCECTEAGKCARCGEQGLTADGDGPCTRCGWDYDDGIIEYC